MSARSRSLALSSLLLLVTFLLILPSIPASLPPDPLDHPIPLGTNSLATDELWASTLFGGISRDEGYLVDTDPEGFVILAGLIPSNTLPNATGFQTSHQGRDDTFVAKLTSDCSAVVWATYLGGSEDDHVSGLAVDGNGAIFLVGWTGSRDFPTTPGAFNNTTSGDPSGFDGFVTKLRPDGGGLLYSTYLRGSRGDHPLDVEVDRQGRAHVCGQTSSRDFPVTSGCYQDRGGNDNGFVTILSADGGSLEASTYLSANGADSCYGLDIGGDGKVYVAGVTTSMGFPTTPGVFQENFAGSRQDAFCARFDSNLTTLERSSYLGASSFYDELAEDIHVDDVGAVFVAGRTNSSAFPTTDGAFQTTYGGGRYDGFVTKVAPDWGSLLYSTFIGGSSEDLIWDLDVDDSGFVYVAGETYSTDLPTTNGAFMGSSGSDNDAFVARLGVNGTVLEYSSYLGGSVMDSARSLLEVGGGNVLVAGTTGSHGFPTTEGAFREGNAGSRDAFVCLMRTDEETPVAEAGQGGTVFKGERVWINASSSTDDLGIAYHIWQYDDGSGTYNPPFHAREFEHIFFDTGVFNYTLTVVDGAGNTGTDSIIFTVIENKAPEVVAGEDITVDQGTTVTLDGGNSTDDAGIWNWTWTFNYGGENVSLDGAVVNFTFDVPGTYAVHLWVTDVLGERGYDQLVVTVLDTEPPVPSMVQEIEAYLGEEVVFDAHFSIDNVGIVDYNWTLEYNGTVLSLPGSITYFTFHIPGTYQVILYLTDAAGNMAVATVQVLVVDLRPPVFRHDWGIGQVVVETIDIVVDFNWTVWTDDDETFPEGANFTYAFSKDGKTYLGYGKYATIALPEGGMYDVTFTAVDASGNTANHTFSLIVRWLPLDASSPIAHAGEDIEVTFRDTVVLRGSYDPGDLDVTDLHWEGPSGLTIVEDGMNITFTADRVGELSFSFTVNDWMGNGAGDTVDVTVIPRTPVVEIATDLNVPLTIDLAVEGTASGDVDIHRLEYRIDGGEWEAADGTAMWALTLAIGDLSNGNHTLEVRAWDGFNHGTAGPVPFVVNVPPDDVGGTVDDPVPWSLIAVGLVICIVLVVIALYVLRKNEKE